MIIGSPVHDRVTPPCQPCIRFLFVGSAFRLRLPSDAASRRTSLPSARGCGRHAPQKTGSSKIHNVLGARKKPEAGHAQPRAI